MDYNKYNDLRVTTTYRVLRDTFGFSREAAIYTLLSLNKMGLFLKHFAIILLAIATIVGILFLFQQLGEKSNEWNEQIRRQQQERSSYLREQNSS